MFALPARTSFRFALLIAAVAASSFTFYQLIYMATPRGPAVVSLMLRCRSQALAHRPSGMTATASMASALQQASVCYSGAERTEAWWGLLGVGVLIAAAGVIFLAQPWWYRRRKHLSELTGDGAAELMNRLEGVRQQAGTGPVIWLLQPLNNHLSAFAFGRPRRRFVAVSGGTAVAAVRKPAAFDAVILHELAHVKNRDIDQTYLALAIWRAFVAAALLPVVVTAVVTGDLAWWQRSLWRVAVLALIVYLLRNSVLRSREFDADARARELDRETQLGPVLAGLPARTGRAWHLGGRHPSGQARAAALLDPAPLYRCGFWDGLAVGLVAAIGAGAVREIVTLMTTTYGIRLLVPAVIFGAFAGAALTVAMWRNQLLEAGTGTVKGWAAGSGLGLGLAAGLIIALPSGAGPALPLAPDQLNPAAVGVLAVWTGLAILIFAPFPVWVGHWADAWQQRADVAAPRVPARGGMIASAAAAWIVMAIGLYLLLLNVTWILGGSSAASVWHQLPQLLRDMGFYITAQYGQPGGWVACLVIMAMPLVAAVAHRGWRRSADAHNAAVPRRRWAATALLCLAGCLTAVALMLAVSAVAHARIAEVVRWSTDFVIRLIFFDEQAIVVVAVICALIAAVRARSAVSAALSVAAGAAVAAVSGLALPNVRSMGHCFASLSIQYAHPPAGGCLTTPDTLALCAVVLGAALVSILFVPAAYAAGMLARRHIRQKRRPASITALGRLAAGIAVIAAVTGTALWGPSASAHGVEAAGNIGRDGWIHGYGYTVRLIPNWYNLTQADKPGLIYFSFPFDGARIQLESLTGVDPVKITEYRSYLLRLGARPDALDGAPGLLAARSGLPGGVLEQWFIVRGPVVYEITLDPSPEWPGDSPYLRDAFSFMLNSWQWTS